MAGIVWVSICLSFASLAAADTVSVLYFHNTTGLSKADWLSKGIADMLITDLAAVEGLTVVEREDLEKVLREQALALSGAAGTDAAVKTGKLLGARKTVTGSYIVTGKKIRLDAKVIDTENGNITAPATAEGKLKDVFTVEKELAAQLIRGLAYTVPAQLTAGRVPSVDALEQYYEGIGFLDVGAFDKAVERFRDAQRSDPLYVKPQQGLAEAYRFLKDFTRMRQQREISALYDFAEKLRDRLAAPAWQTYADLIMTSGYAQMDQAAQKRFNEEHAVYLQCNSPAQCTWRLIITLWEIGNKTAGYFGDTVLNDSLCAQAVALADRARDTFKDDPDLAEILAFQITILALQKDYQRVKSAAESFMVAYPDYRMIESVEDHYRKALDALKEAE